MNPVGSSLTDLSLSQKGKNMANILTGIRLLCGLALPFVPAFSRWFYILYLLGGFTDAIDGAVARRLSAASPFGAKFDTAADMVYFLSALAVTVCAARFPMWLIVWIGAVALFKVFAAAYGFFRYRRFVTVHSAANRVCGLLTFAVPLYVGILPWRFSALPVILTCTAASAAALREWRGIRAEGSQRCSSITGRRQS